jgi:uncharacterized membrane protein
MLDIFTNIVSVTGYAVEGIGVVIIVAGSVLATFRSLGRGSNKQGDDKFRKYRRDIGRAMMLGLEFLVAGDIIRTVVVTHSIESIAALGLVVLIRTVLVFTIHLEVEGHWPWQPPHPVSNRQGGD